MPAASQAGGNGAQLYAGLPDIHMNTAKGVPSKWQTGKAMATYKDIHMDTARLDPTKKMSGLKARDKLRMEEPEIRRKATVAQLCESCPSSHLFTISLTLMP